MMKYTLNTERLMIHTWEDLPYNPNYCLKNENCPHSFCFTLVGKAAEEYSPCVHSPACWNHWCLGYHLNGLEAGQCATDFLIRKGDGRIPNYCRHCFRDNAKELRARLVQLYMGK